MMECLADCMLGDEASAGIEGRVFGDVKNDDLKVIFASTLTVVGSAGNNGTWPGKWLESSERLVFTCHMAEGTWHAHFDDRGAFTSWMPGHDHDDEKILSERRAYAEPYMTDDQGLIVTLEDDDTEITEVLEKLKMSLRFHPARKRGGGRS